jgi:hypothetical protein
VHLPTGRERIRAVLEGVEAERGPYGAVIEGEPAQVLDAIHAGARSEIGSDEFPVGEERAQIAVLIRFHLKRSELHDRFLEPDLPVELCDEVCDQGLRHGAAELTAARKPKIATLLPRNTARILDTLGANDRVLDVGGWAAPFNRATHMIDVMPYETRGPLGSYGPKEEHFGPETWVTRDFCDHEPWPWEDDYFDFALCVTTLEDIRDPIAVCRQMSRVARAGYIEVPTLLAELGRRVDQGGPWLGHDHHRWLCEIDEEAESITFTHKRHSLHFLPRVRVRPRWLGRLSLDEHLQGLFWNGSIDAGERLLIDEGPPVLEYTSEVRSRFPAGRTRRGLEAIGDRLRYRFRARARARANRALLRASRASRDAGEPDYYNPPGERRAADPG